MQDPPGKRRTPVQPLKPDLPSELMRAVILLRDPLQAEYVFAGHGDIYTSLTAVCRIRFAKGYGDLEPSACFPRLHGVKSYASRGAPRSKRGRPTSLPRLQRGSPSLPCFCESASRRRSKLWRAGRRKPNSPHGGIALCRHGAQRNKNVDGYPCLSVLIQFIKFIQQ